MAESNYIAGFEKGIRVAADLGHRIGFVEGAAEVRLKQLNEGCSTGNEREIQMLHKIIKSCAEIKLESTEDDLPARVGLIEKLARTIGIVKPVTDQKATSSAGIDAASLQF